MNGKPPDHTTILVVEEDARLRELLSAAVDGPEINVIRVRNEAEAFNCLMAETVGIVIAPLRAAAEDGARLLKIAQQRNANVAVILTVEPNSADTDSAVRLMMDGAHDFLVKPVNTRKLRAVTQKVLRQQALLNENRALHDRLTHPSELLGFTGKSAPMRAFYDRLIRLAAAPNTTVLICGESGTGKEVAARALHFHSPRRKGPLVSLNCAAIPESLIESELFGHEAGSFTGASKRRRGRFELAHEGTLVLDEIGEMTLPAQAKLLRVLETREFERIGGERPIRVDVRIVAITNRDLASDVKAGRFRADLYHRLRVAMLQMPPLRERVEDIRLLVNVFLEEFREETGRPVKGITSRALRLLERYPWYGNVRELKNCIEAMVVVAQGAILDVDDLPDWLLNHERVRELRPQDLFETAPTVPSVVETFGEKGDGSHVEEGSSTGRKQGPVPMPVYAGMTWREIEREAIRATLELTHGNKAEAARVLRIGRRTLFRKIKEYEL